MAINQHQLFSDAQKQQAMADTLQGRSLQQRGPQQMGPVASKMHWGEGIAQLGEALLARRAGKQADQKFGQAEEARRKAIADSLSGMGGNFGQAQQAIESGVDPALIDQWMQSQQPQAPVKLGEGETLLDPNNQYAQLASGPEKQVEQPTLVKEYEYAKGQGYQGSLQDFAIERKKAGAASSTVNVKSEGPIPADYTAERDAQGNLTGYKVVPGSKTATEQAAAAEKKKKAEEITEQKGDIVLEEIERSLTNMSGGILPETGMIGDLLSNVGNTDAKALANTLQTIKSNIGFDRIEQMRATSPTGAALGNITEGERASLQAVMGSLEQSQRKEDLEYNLKRLNNVYLDLVHGPGEGPERIELPPIESKPGFVENMFKKFSGADGDDPLNSLTPEQRAKYGLN